MFYIFFWSFFFFLPFFSFCRSEDLQNPAIAKYPILILYSFDATPNVFGFYFMFFFFHFSCMNVYMYACFCMQVHMCRGLSFISRTISNCYSTLLIDTESLNLTKSLSIWLVLIASLLWGWPISPFLG